MKRERKPISACTALTLRLGALALGLWLACMGLFTVGTAQYVSQELLEKGDALADYAARRSNLDACYGDASWDLGQAKGIPGYLEHEMLVSLRWGSVRLNPPTATTDELVSWSVFGEEAVPCQVALAFVNQEGEPIHQSGDFLYFDYVTQETWDQAQEAMPTDGYGWLDLSDPQDSRYDLLRTTYGNVRGDLLLVEALRLTGTFEGGRFEPWAMDLLTAGDYAQAVDAWTQEQAGQPTPQPEGGDVSPDTGGVASTGSSGTGSSTGGGVFTLGLLDRLGLLAWQEHFDHTGQAPAGEELVTIYATRLGMSLYQPSGQVRYRGQAYGTLLDLLLSQAPQGEEGLSGFLQGGIQRSLWNTVVFSGRTFTDLSGYGGQGDAPSPDFTLIAAVQASPMLVAMGFLKHLYLATFLAGFAGVWLLRRCLQKRLLEPLGELARSAAGGHRLPTLEEKPPRWREPALLCELYVKTGDSIRRDKNEMARLNTALAYARTAEEQRRQLTSHLAHQLKTPLAIIHSYAEGLGEHINEEKRDQYVEVILSEAERCDKMVLELLDLSRLEAGKVKLSRDEFSLPQLVRTVFESLDRAIQEKGLQVELHCPEELALTADESRLAQAVENLAENAVKYTPAGGRVVVTVAREGDQAVFFIENQCAPLTQQELRDVWEPFFRGQAAAGQEGTGLGLPIVKHIVSLHGGRCWANAGALGAAFGFSVPV